MFKSYHHFQERHKEAVVQMIVTITTNRFPGEKKNTLFPEPRFMPVVKGF